MAPKASKAERLVLTSVLGVKVEVKAEGAERYRGIFIDAPVPEQPATNEVLGTETKVDIDPESSTPVTVKQRRAKPRKAGS